mmetsp:Transcript_20969/g.45899  ORF Transcript_20969/g.45899 Transcript_20969/m.45899 type:complete len:266 (-) Transcript_20969:1086-1883(-)|eukprot:CAMPEP_0202918350 /NCGR_PEP_ID=MMETSP1392-20130828/73232_1 /ASSEMBLY_ACC=CAM_ASM_000868 /TAXON_ID=225041 /ORGANISM="Chlamydomonas chlamydogama, Strain SAG 11-48b" /LENGTH=265 /DNA_ID=CAMNT_0049611383 /DNA_START=290 /DNA_END=1087 /DNA_ORIENTATION=-
MKWLASKALLPLAMLVFCAAAFMPAHARFQLPALPYDTAALEPVIDNQTMINHHRVHHLAYVNNLNNLLNGSLAAYPHLRTATLHDIVTWVGTNKLPKTIETAVRNNAGGAWNHALFWRVMAPANSASTATPDYKTPFGAAVQRAFGNYSVLTTAMRTAGAGRFGSGWSWLVVNPRTRNLQVLDSANQDNHLMPLLVKKKPFIPILGLDVWEHAYYLKYGPSRANYMSSWLQVINWQQVSKNYDAAVGRRYEELIGQQANAQLPW